MVTEEAAHAPLKGAATGTETMTDAESARFRQRATARDVTGTTMTITIAEDGQILSRTAKDDTTITDEDRSSATIIGGTDTKTREGPDLQNSSGRAGLGLPRAGKRRTTRERESWRQCSRAHHSWRTTARTDWQP